MTKPIITKSQNSPHTFHTKGRFVMAPMIECVTVEIPIDLATNDVIVVQMQDIHGRPVAAHLRVIEIEPR